MRTNKLHPDVEEFKHFINNRPELVLELRKSGRSLQYYYDKWAEYGEDESIWHVDKKQTKETGVNENDLFNQIVKYTENLDVDKIQGHVQQLNKVLDIVQSLLNNFIGQKGRSPGGKRQTELFNLFRD